jgi:hypothetical protein
VLNNPAAARPLRSVGYLIALLLFLLPVGEVAVTAWPFAWGQALWRYSLGGMSATSSATMLVGALLILVMAAWNSQPRMLILGSTLCFLAGIFYFGIMPLVALDAIQLKSSVPATDPGRFKLTAARILLKLALSGLAFILVAVANLRIMRSYQREQTRTAKNPAPVMQMR